MNSYYESVRESIGYVEFQNSPTRCEPHWHQAVEILCACGEKAKVIGEIQKGEHTVSFR